MGKIAFVFPGQGSQYAGMGKELYDGFASARGVFEEADRALGFDLSRICFEGPEEQLRLTENTQPAILAVSIATLAVLSERGLRPHYVAGHSLGEYSALVCAEALEVSDATRIVKKRGRFMQEAVPPGRGAMAAVLGLEAGVVEKACLSAREFGVVSAANFNSPQQTVIAGDTMAVEKASEAARSLGAKRVIPLPVSAPFHCDLMAPAQDRLAAELKKAVFKNLIMPLITNVDAQLLVDGEAARESLVRQVCAPVRWVESVRCMANQGVDVVVEVGPGKVLSGLVKKIAPHLQVYAADGIRGIEALASLRLNATM